MIQLVDISLKWLFFSTFTYRCDWNTKELNYYLASTKFWCCDTGVFGNILFYVLYVAWLFTTTKEGLHKFYFWNSVGKISISWVINCVLTQLLRKEEDWLRGQSKSHMYHFIMIQMWTHSIGSIPMKNTTKICLCM